MNKEELFLRELFDQESKRIRDNDKKQKWYDIQMDLEIESQRDQEYSNQREFDDQYYIGANL